MRLLASFAIVQASGAVMSGAIAAENAMAQDPHEIVVIATRLSGQVDTPQPPVIVLDEAEITSYGASSLAELLEATSPQTSSGRARGGGHPLILVNGQRLASFREFRNVPPEAVQRMEVLTEEVAMRFGGAPNQRVVNFILKSGFASRTIDAEYRLPERGGFSENELETSLVRFGKSSRLNLNASAKDSSALFEAERGVIQSPGSIPSLITDPDPARARSLIADSRELSLTGSWTGNLSGDGSMGSLSLNGSITRSDSQSFSGFNTATLTDPLGSSLLRSFGEPLRRNRQTLNLSGGGTYNLSLGNWRMTATIDASHDDVRSQIDRRADTSSLLAEAASGTLPIDGMLPLLPSSGTDRTRSRTLSVNSLLTLSGTLANLPAGELAATIKGGYEHSAIRSIDSRLAGKTHLARNDRYAGITLSLPITSRRNGVLADLGDLALNLSIGMANLSDIGSLVDWSAGLTWSPFESLGLQASWFVDQEAPGLADLGNPATQSFNVPVYDFRRGETAQVTITEGGNPALARERQRDLKLAANWTLPVLRNSSLLIEYFRNRSRNVTAAFPLLSVPIEDAFPYRILRDGSGRLLAIDRRPITLSRTSGSRLRWGINLSGPLARAIAPDRPRSGGMPGFGDDRPGMDRRGSGQGRWNLSLYHTLRFIDRVLVAPGGPSLDLLGGDALSGGGSLRHGLEIEGGTFYRGFGLRLRGRWNGPSRLQSSGAPGTSDLRFSSLLDMDLRAFINFDMQKSLVERLPLLKGARIAISIENMFNTRQKITDASGLTPLSYQRDYLDPRGRVFEIDLRKAF